jgi:hypothetical protein
MKEDIQIEMWKRESREIQIETTMRDTAKAHTMYVQDSHPISKETNNNKTIRY